MLMVISVVVVAVLHIAFLIMEMFLWATPLGLKISGMPEAQAQETKKLAKNMGLYNGFLSVGLFWGLWQNSITILIFFLLFITLAGIYGGLTVSRAIAYIQAVPAIVALVFVWGKFYT